jgi:hypothetical protein
MNVFNKVVVILLLLVVMIVIPLILIFPEQAEYALRYAADVIQANLDWVNNLQPAAQVGVRLLLAMVGMIVFLVGLLLLVLEIFRIRRKTVRLRDKSGELMVDSITEHLSYHLDLLPDVLRVRPRVKSRGKNVRTTIYVETPPEVNVPEKSVEVKETARQVLEDRLGLETKGQIKVVVRPVAYPKISRAERQPPRVERPVAPPIAPVKPVAEKEEELPSLEEEYVSPFEISEPPQAEEEEEELPSLEEEYVSPFVIPEPSQEEEAERPYLEEDFMPPLQEDEEDTDEGDSTTLDVKGPSSPPFG